MSSTIDKFFKSDFNLIQDLSDADSDDQEASSALSKSQLSEVSTAYKPNVKKVNFWRHKTPEEYQVMKDAEGNPL